MIGHRGASGYRPEHTLAAYEQAIVQCADFIEPDVVATSDGVLVARHENEIGGTTDVASPHGVRRSPHDEGDRRRQRHGLVHRGLHARRAEDAAGRSSGSPPLRPQNTAFNGLYQVPTLDEVLDLARHSRTCDGEPVGVYPETKHPTYFDGIGLSLEEPLVATLEANGFGSRSAPVYIQSFEVGNLRELATMTRVPLVQLINCTGAPYDLVAAGDPRTYADLVTPAGLREIARYADGIGVCKDVMIPRTATGTLGHRRA